MRPALCLSLVLAAACQEPRPAVAPAAPRTHDAVASAPAPDAGAAWSADALTCVDRWLAAQKLDAYGSPQGTMYAGGTPLFDEATGQSTPRQVYLARHKPEALRACGLTP